MGTAASAEPCVYERLWESIAVLRESGQRYGMSERDIERFITQVLQTNEPQEPEPEQEREPDQPGFPLLRATAKCALALCLLLVLGLGLSPPQSHSGPLTLGFNWTCPLGAARLLDLPIAHKYNLREYRGWWMKPPPPPLATVNSSACREEAQPLLLKGGSVWRLQRSRLQQLLQTHPNSVSVRVTDRLSLQGATNFTVHWRSTGGAAEPLLFPLAPPPLLDRAGTALRRCVVSNVRETLPHLSTGVRVQGWVVLGEGEASLSMAPLCPHHNNSRIQLRPGDRVFSDPSLWTTELTPGSDQTVFCDGSAP